MLIVFLVPVHGPIAVQRLSVRFLPIVVVYVPTHVLVPVPVRTTVVWRVLV